MSCSKDITRSSTLIDEPMGWQQPHSILLICASVPPKVWSLHGCMHLLRIPRCMNQSLCGPIQYQAPNVQTSSTQYYCVFLAAGRLSLMFTVYLCTYHRSMRVFMWSKCLQFQSYVLDLKWSLWMFECFGNVSRPFAQLCFTVPTLFFDRWAVTHLVERW